MKKSSQFAVVFSGCGFQDGAEIHESVLTLLAITKAGASYQCFAPDMDQVRVVNHLTGKKIPEKRNVLVESARIARGKIQPLSEFDEVPFDAIIFPGGFGAAMNLCTFAVDGEHCRIQPDVEKAVRAMHKAKKPIGVLCIAPVIVAQLLKGVELTLGQDQAVHEKIRKMGAVTKNTAQAQVVVDKEQRVVSTPCYMLESTIADIALGAENLVKAVMDLINKK